MSKERKKVKNIRPQHIPGGENYSDESLKELNSKIKQFGIMGLTTIVVLLVVCITLSIVMSKVIGGFVGNLLGLILIIVMPVLIVLAGKLEQGIYLNPAKKIGLTPEQVRQAIDNRNKNVAAWGVIPDDALYEQALTPEEAKKAKKKRVGKVILIIGIVLVVVAGAALGYDQYLTSMSNRLIVELSSGSGSISESEFNEMQSAINKRAEYINSVNGDDSIPISLECELVDGKMKCTSNSNSLNEYTFYSFYWSGDYSIVDENDNTIISESEIKDLECLPGKYSSDDKLAITFTDEGFEKIKAIDGTVSIRYEGLKDENGNPESEVNYSVESLIQNSEGTTCYFSSVSRRTVYSMIYKLPYEWDSKIIKAGAK